MQLQREANFSRLGTDTFDVVVIGGGINGCAMAWDAAARGLKTALVERDDFGGATSAGSFKTIHGGLRYLQHLDLRRLFESVGEQRALRKIAPHLLTPLRFLVPCYGYGGKSPEFLRLGLSVYEALTPGRNAGVQPALELPGHEFVSKEHCVDYAPGISADGLRGGVLFSDCQMFNSERLTLSFVLSAAAKGAVCCNYAEVTGAVLEEKPGSGRTISAVRVQDRLSGSAAEIRTRSVINASGPWTEIVNDRLLWGKEQKRPFVFSKGVQLIVPSVNARCAVALESRFRDHDAVVSRGNRSYFIVPWRGHSLLGTADILHTSRPDEYKITQSEIERFLDEVASVYRSEVLKRENVLFAFGGLRPVEPSVLARVARGEIGDYGTVEAAHRDMITDHAAEDGVSNLLSVIGIKYTTARKLAEITINRLRDKRIAPMKVCETEHAPLYGADTGDIDRFIADQQSELKGLFNPALVDRLCREFGSQVNAIARIAREEPALAEPLAESNDVCGAEVLYAVRHELAVKLSDAIMRRTALGALGCPGKHCLKRTAEIMAKELGWDETRSQAEVSEAESLFVFA